MFIIIAFYVYINHTQIIMKFRISILVYIFILLPNYGQAQGRQNKGHRPTLNQVSNKELVQSIYPEADKVTELNNYWYKIVNKQSKTIGYAITSRKYCDHIIGYNNTTPIMIITDKNMIIRKVALLSNYETPSYVKRLEDNGFFKLWNGLKLDRASNIELDGFTGATMTADAVAENLKYLIENAKKKLPNDVSKR